MSFNRGDIRGDVRRRMEEFVTTVISESDINQEIKYTVRDLEGKIDFRELMATDSTTVTVVDQQEYTLPVTNIRKFIDFVEDPGTDDISYSEIDYLDRLEAKNVRGVNLGDVAGGHVYYLFGTTTIGLLPIPDTAGRTLKIDYYSYQADQTDDTTDYLLPDLVREAIVTRTTAKLMIADETIPNATIQNELNVYDRLVAEARDFIGNTSRKFSNQFKNY